MLSFFGGRVVTLVIEEIILLVFITWLGFNSMVVKDWEHYHAVPEYCTMQNVRQ